MSAREVQVTPQSGEVSTKKRLRTAGLSQGGAIGALVPMPSTTRTSSPSAVVRTTWWSLKLSPYAATGAVGMPAQLVSVPGAVGSAIVPTGTTAPWSAEEKHVA